MATDRCTSKSKSNPKTRVARQWGQMVQAWCTDFHGTVADLEVAKGNRLVKARFYQFLRELIAEAANAILAFVGTKPISALPAGDVATLFPEQRQTNGLKCCWESNFRKVFGGMRFGPTQPTDLAAYRLVKNCLDNTIIRLLDGQEMVATCLGYIAHLISLQPNGEEDGALLVSGAANIFYVYDEADVLWAVCCYWQYQRREWFLNAYSVFGYGTGWRAGGQVFVCDSSDS